MGHQIKTDLADKARRILLAEGSPSDALLFQLAFTSQDLPVEIETLFDGQRLISRLRQLAETKDREVRLAVLDVNLPRLTAEEILNVLNTEGIKLDIPLVVLISFLPEARVNRFHQLGVTKILVKPMDFAGYLQLAAEVASLCETTKST